MKPDLFFGWKSQLIAVFLRRTKRRYRSFGRFRVSVSWLQFSKLQQCDETVVRNALIALLGYCSVIRQLIVDPFFFRRRSWPDYARSLSLPRLAISFGHINPLPPVHFSSFYPVFVFSRFVRLFPLLPRISYFKSSPSHFHLSSKHGRAIAYCLPSYPIVFRCILIHQVAFTRRQRRTFRSLSQAATCPPVYHTRRRLHTVPLIAERRAGKL